MRFAITLELVLAAMVATACGDNRPTLEAGKSWRLAPQASSVSIKSGGAVPLRFMLVSKAGAGVAGERVEFAALREAEVTGATLSASSALTDGQGVATVNVMAGRPTTFEISAQNPRAEPSRVQINVFEARMAILTVLPDLDAGFSPPQPVASVDLSVFSDRLCTSFSPILPPVLAVPAQMVYTVALGASTEVSIDRVKQNALLAQGRDADGHLEAVGCVDVPSSTILQSVNGRVALLLSAVALTPSTSYELSAHFKLAKHNLAARVAAPWQDLTDCPLDPAQAWLDCTVDALTAPPGKALDCVPSPTDEAHPLAAAIAAHRGSLPSGSSCRPSALEDGSPSVDAELAALFPNSAQSSTSASPPASPTDGNSLTNETTTDSTTASAPDLLGGLAVITGYAAHMLDDFSVTSSLRLDATSTMGAFHGTHTLRSAIFSIDNRAVRSDVLPLGIPESQARFIGVQAVGSTLSVSEHHLALRLGTLARMAFEQAASTRLGLDPGIDNIVDALFALASTQPGPDRKTGCQALDAVVCADVKAAPGCVLDACVAGQGALSTRLCSGFESANGEDADLQLSGAVDMNDADGDGFAETLGPGPSAKWLARFRSAGPTESVSGELSTLSTASN